MVSVCVYMHHLIKLVSIIFYNNILVKMANSTHARLFSNKAKFQKQYIYIAFNRLAPFIRIPEGMSCRGMSCIGFAKLTELSNAYANEKCHLSFCRLFNELIFIY